MKTRLVLLTVVTMLTLLVGSVGIAAAQAEGPPEPGGDFPRPGRVARLYGLIDEIEEATLILATPLGSVNLITDANTVFRIPGVEDPGLEDLTVGDVVAAGGWWEREEGAFHAFGVARLESDHVLPLAGELTDVGDDTLAVETPHGAATVHVNDETSYRVRGVEDPDLDDLEVGMKVVVRGTLEADGALLAQGIGAQSFEPRPIRARGEVLAVEGDTLVVRPGRGREISLLTDETTEFRVPGVENPSIAEVEVGDRIAGEGVIEEPGVVRATLVIVLPEQLAALNGEVAAVEDTTLVLETRGGLVDVLTDADTIFRVPGVEDPGLDDVGVGDQIVAAGTWEDEATFHAIVVGVRGGRREGQRGAAQGRAIEIGADHLALGTPQGPLTVLVDDQTQYRVPGVDDPGLEDIEEGVRVGARGVWNRDGDLLAEGVAVMDSKRARTLRKRR